MINLGALEAFDTIQRKYIYDFNPKDKSKWIKLRTNGSDNILTIKEAFDDESFEINNTEIYVSDFDITHNILSKLRYSPRCYQENKRNRYYLHSVEIDIDTWPLIPTFIKIRGRSEEDVIMVVKLLGYKKSDVIFIDIAEIYDKYGIDINSIETLKFEER